MEIARLVLVSILILSACTPGGDSSLASDESASTTSTSLTGPSTASVATDTTHASTTTTPVPSHDMEVIRVDPATLDPLPGTEPLAIGDGIAGYVSDNGQWLGLNVWVEPDTSTFRVVEVATGETVTEKPHGLWPVGVGDDGVVYSFSDLTYSGPRFRRLPPGADGLETVFDDFPADFSFWGRSVVLGPSGAVWLGRFGGAFADKVAGVVVVDLATGEATTHELGDLDLDAANETEAASRATSALADAVPVWDEARNRLLIAHRVEPKVSVLDLGTGEIATHDWSPSTSWFGALLAWFVPPAHAKGEPSPELTGRGATLSRSGDWLYLASSNGVEMIDTDSWEMAHRWDITASGVSLSPDGEFLVVEGPTRNESVPEGQVEDVVVVDTNSREIVGRFEPPGSRPGIDFSPDGRYLYISESSEGSGGRIDIVDLTVMDVVGRTEGRVLGRAGVLVRNRP